MADQITMRILYLGPSPDEEDSVVVTAELACGCQITRTMSERRIKNNAGGQQSISGETPCPKGHPTPSWQRNRGSSLVAMALGRM